MKPKPSNVSPNIALRGSTFLLFITARGLWRRRKALMPIWALGLVFVGCTLLNLFLPSSALILLILGGVLAVSPWILPIEMRDHTSFIVPPSMDTGEPGSLDGVTERVYITIFSAIATLALTGMVYFGWNGIAPWVLLFAGIAVSLPWFVHYIINRIGVTSPYGRKLRKALAAAGAEDAQLIRLRKPEAGQPFTSMLIKLPSDVTAGHLQKKIEEFDTAFSVRPGGTQIEQAQSNARYVIIRVRPRDPFAKAVTLPAFDFGRSVRDGIVLGVNERQAEVTVDLNHTLLLGQTGSGKSMMIDAIMCQFCTFNDLVVVGADLASGAGLEPWSDVLQHPLATTPQETSGLLDAVLQATEYRERLLASGKKDNGEGPDSLEPSPELPWIVVLVDEFEQYISMAGPDKASQLAKRARKVGIRLVFATQNPNAKAVGGNELKAQFPLTIGLRLTEYMSKLLWGDLAKRGWASHRLTTVGAFLVRDAKHDSPVTHRGFMVSSENRIQAKEKCANPKMDPGTAKFFKRADPPLRTIEQNQARVYEALKQTSRGVKVIEITGLSRPTVWKYLNELTELGRVRKDGADYYRMDDES